MTRTFCIAGSLFALAIAAGIGQTTFAQSGGAGVPRLQVDPFFPKPLGNHWVLGSVTGVTVDAQDHIWAVHRGVDSLQNNEKGPTLEPWASQCCFSAPQVLEFDAAGTLLGKWGGPGQGFDWPHDPAGIVVDAKGSVWIAGGLPTPAVAAGRGAAPARGAPAAGAPARGAGAPDAAAGGRGAGRGARGGAPAAAGDTPAAGQPPQAPAGRGRGAAGPPPPADAQVLKFSKTGQFQLQIGHAGKQEGSDSQTGLNRPAGVDVDNAANEVYVADGFGNHRIVVFDATTGAYKRSWGAYGEKPVDAELTYDPNGTPARQFHTVSCVHLSKDGMVYVCDRQNDRIQVFQKDGKFVKEGFVSKTTTGDGSVWDIAFSRDAQQSQLFVADGHDKKVWVVTRSSLETVGSFGDGGRLPGHFYGVGSVALDSKGNVYTGETYEGKRVQKFVKK